jgi:mono/diheme cytochrome c family protein
MAFEGSAALAAALVLAASALTPAAAHADEALFKGRCASCHEVPSRLQGQTVGEKASLLDAFLKTHYADRTGMSDARVRAQMVTYLVGLAGK